MLITLSTFVDFGIPCAPIASISRLGLFGTSTNPSVQSASPRAAPFVRNRTKFVSDRSEQLWFHQNPDAYRSPSARPFRPQIHTLVEPIVLSNHVFRSSKSVQPLLSYRRFCLLHSAEPVCNSFFVWPHCRPVPAPFRVLVVASDSCQRPRSFGCRSSCLRSLVVSVQRILRASSVVLQQEPTVFAFRVVWYHWCLQKHKSSSHNLSLLLTKSLFVATLLLAFRSLPEASRPIPSVSG